MKNQTFKVTDEVAASIEAGRYKTKFSHIEKKVEYLQKSNLPVYLDILYKHLGRGGGALIREYVERFAKENYMNLSNEREAKILYEKFAILSDPYHRWTFNKKFLTLHPDGSFELNEKAVDEYFRDKFTYEVTKEQFEAIEAILKGLNTLGAHPKYVADCFYIKDKEVKLNRVKLYALITGGSRSLYTM
ncbi:MAG: hypothetical protein PHQ88_08415 [Bacteroides sp.]|nr:hypothetical protein [Bacteroides sp.]MDD4055340.1 hypothetical protein [Bacteroides sp.]MDD4720861.1 hypothetical protein [Bacteroides sp.]